MFDVCVLMLRQIQTSLLSIKKNNSGQALLLAGIIFLSACSYFPQSNSEKQNAVARVFDKYLYKHELASLVPKGASKQDSLMIVRNFIEDWVKQNVVLHKAELNLGEEQKNVENQLNEYRNSLITFIYEKELVRQRLDTTVTETEIENYYTEHEKNFVLKDNIIKMVFLKANKKAPKLDKAKKWMRSKGDKDKQLLEEYCHQYCIDYLLDDTNWMLFDDLLKKVPVKTYDKEAFLQNNRFIEITDSANVYFVNIADFQIKESLSPLSFERDNIRALIINKRKLELIQQMQKAAFEQAQKNNDFEIYTK
jgi:hypothetical protein